MKIKLLETSLLKPYDKNPRKHPEEQIVALAAAIKEFGFDQPIVVGPDYVIIKGHGRLLAAQRLGLEKVPVVVRAISENDAKFLRAADNEVVSGDWDYHALKLEMADLTLEGFDLSTTGFDTPGVAEVQGMIEEAPAPKASAAVAIASPQHTCAHCGYKF
jgi:ParB-like chromosome segregation protein Spo0J